MHPSFTKNGTPKFSNLGQPNNLLNEKYVRIDGHMSHAETQNLKLLVVGVKWPPETFLQRLLNGLSNTGVHVTVATSDASGQSEDLRLIAKLYAPTLSGNSPGCLLLRLMAKFVKALYVSPHDTWRCIFHGWKAPGWKEMFYVLYRNLPFCGERPDLVYFPWISHVGSYPLFFDWGATVFVSCRGAQINVLPHSLQRRNYNELLREIFQKVAAVHCVSEAIQEEGKKYGLEQQKSWIIRPAVDPSLLKPSEEVVNQNKSVIRVIATGSLIWRKGYEYALLAIKELVQKGHDIQYLIIGDGDERQRILYTISDLGLEKYVQLYGKCPPNEVCQLLQCSDIFLLSSLSEGISNAVLEAMACGLPIVTTDCGGMKEAVTDGVEGFVVPVRDPLRMAHAIQTLVGNKALRSKMGNAARQRVLQQFTLQEQIQKFTDLFRDLLDSKAGCVRCAS